MNFIKIGVSLLTVSILSASPAQNAYVQKCASCHGVNGDMKAMGTSKAIKEMSVEEIEKALINYASGERKAMPFVQNLKKDFVNKHSNEELHELATYIHDLNM
ncbi:c-type cytochrome [Sulfurovum sp. XTW-4]|uniref:C-type cytochrome n=1 Tax=Sulfurovum xiamenensis TaxID=3019066 RepID=A0ABT7QQC7_9BACT|nr:c-type cytochrome [Sulfurovum xiamenensis]MDM5263289.1 c-type cytochrome [Sulfurovum xiamenensis]